jgi:cell wall-associated NlpC family hydrolase
MKLTFSSHKGWIFFVILVLIFQSCKTSNKSIPSKSKKTPRKEKVSNSNDFSKYHSKFGYTIPSNANPKLIETVDSWLGVPYKYGANSKSGTDCSGMIGQVVREVYGINLDRSSNDIFDNTKKISKSQLAEGDLVFFKIDTKKVGHVGLHLHHGYFVHATTRKGVLISNLEETYWKKYFIGCGRFLK